MNVSINPAHSALPQGVTTVVLADADSAALVYATEPRVPTPQHCADASAALTIALQANGNCNGHDPGSVPVTGPRD